MCWIKCYFMLSNNKEKISRNFECGWPVVKWVCDSGKQLLIIHHYILSMPRPSIFLLYLISQNTGIKQNHG